MIRLNNTNEIKVGDMIIGIPTVYLFSLDTPLVIDTVNNCFKMVPLDCDIESFAEEIKIAECVWKTSSNICFIDKSYKFADERHFTWDVDVDMTDEDEYSIWKI